MAQITISNPAITYSKFFISIKFMFNQGKGCIRLDESTKNEYGKRYRIQDKNYIIHTFFATVWA